MQGSLFHAYVSSWTRFKGSLTHLQALQISIKFLLQVASDIRIFVKVLELKTFQFRNKNKTHNPDFLLISLIAKSFCTYTFRRKLFICQTLHYSNKLKSFIACHRKLSFHVTINLISFQDPPTIFCKCVILPLTCEFH